MEAIRSREGNPEGIEIERKDGGFSWASQGESLRL
jgi:hypothetical protein